MARIKTEPPDRDSYNHVLWLPKEAPHPNPILFQARKSFWSRLIEWRGKQHHLLFVNTRAEALRAWREGWTDITDEWFVELGPEPEPELPDVSPDALFVLGLLVEADEPLSASAIKAQTEDLEWGDVRQQLISTGVATKLGRGGGTTYSPTDIGKQVVANG